LDPTPPAAPTPTPPPPPKPISWPDALLDTAAIGALAAFAWHKDISVEWAIALIMYLVGGRYARQRGGGGGGGTGTGTGLFGSSMLVAALSPLVALVSVPLSGLIPHAPLLSKAVRV